ncbi:MAG: hypothetical protein JXB07_19645 [Anaerolineae bacterium]|nr:hypothetical protein [Anaerolineae bacterium]
MEKITNHEVASTFATIADMLEIKGESVHRILAYRRAAETISVLPRDLHAVYKEGKLTDLPGIGSTLAEKIAEMLTTGKLTFFEQLSEEIPPGVVEMLRVSGIGPKKAARFWNELGIIDLDQLKKAAQAGKLRDLPGMGAKSEAAILESIEARSRHSNRWSIGDAYPIAQRLLEQLLNIDGVLHGDVAGSLRRYRATIGDIDLLIASHQPEPIMKAFAQASEVARVLAQGTTKSSVELHSGLQVDLRVLPPERYGTLLAYFGSTQNCGGKSAIAAFHEDL